MNPSDSHEKVASKLSPQEFPDPLNPPPRRSANDVKWSKLKMLIS